MSNVFGQYATKETQHAIEAMDGATVTLRELSLDESTAISNKAVKGLDDKGKPIMDLEEAGKIKYYKISAALVEPKMTPEDLGALSSSASKALDEIYALIDPEAAKAVEDAKGKQSEK